MPSLPTTRTLHAALLLSLALPALAHAAHDERAEQQPPIAEFHTPELHMVISGPASIDARSDSALVIDAWGPSSSMDMIERITDITGPLTTLEWFLAFAAPVQPVPDAVVNAHVDEAWRLGRLHLDVIDAGVVAAAAASAKAQGSSECGSDFADNIHAATPEVASWTDQVNTVNLFSRRNGWVCAGVNPVQAGTTNPLTESSCTQYFNTGLVGGVCNPLNATGSISTRYFWSYEGETLTTGPNVTLAPGSWRRTYWRPTGIRFIRGGVKWSFGAGMTSFTGLKTAVGD
jgi:hypothetical protein